MFLSCKITLTFCFMCHLHQLGRSVKAFSIVFLTMIYICIEIGVRQSYLLFYSNVLPLCCLKSPIKCADLVVKLKALR